MKRNSRRILYTVLLALGAAACSRGHDSKTEEQMIKALTTHRTDQVTSIDLNTILPKGWTRVCVQMPYMLQDTLEKAANAPVKHFSMITDNDSPLRMWIFYAKDDPGYISIPRKTVMDFSSPNVVHNFCNDPKQTELNLTMINDSKTFYFN